ncbi:ATP-grasp domain-containing protein [Modestobacter versicolor]|uniref:ATP-grasp domain-containing protein n=1 Tax=Modestobacter versicolor TaxID=429133 RepID=UPI0034DF3C8F
MIDVGVATCAAVPQLDEDGPLLLAALAEVGVRARPVVWDDPEVDWPAFDAVLVRSTWDYPLRRAEFLRWAGGCPRTVNPVDVLAWNTDKRYLDDLARAGVPTVPTVLVPPGTAWTAPDGDHVVKPTVSGSAADTGRFRGPGDPEAAALVARLHAQGRTAMVQPYLPGIEVEGETSLVYLGGELSHAVRRAPLLTDVGVRSPVVVADVMATLQAVPVAAQQRAVAEAAVDAVPGGRTRLAYARVDLVPGADGPVVLELEATDCFLFLSFADDAARARLAEHVVAQLA